MIFTLIPAKILAEIQSGMNRGVYSLANGMIASQSQLDVVTNNLANVNTSGFKADQVLFNETLEKQMSVLPRTNIGSLGSGPTAKSEFTNLQQGALNVTNNNLDFALQGPGMFAVQTSTGQVMYTRGGAFTQDASGNLTTKDGSAVLDSDGKPIQLKPGAFTVSASGQISSNNGTPAYASLGIFTGNFTKGSNGLYAAADATAQTAKSAGTTIKQGALETSNVNSITSMVQMISLQRSFDMAQKSMWAEDDMTQKLSTILT